MWKTILLPHDFSSGADRAATLAHDLAKVHGARLVILHVAELKRELEREGVEVSFEAVIGHPAAEITTVAEKLGADVIVMGTHGRTGLVRALLGSVAAKVVRHSKVPVVTIRIDD